MEARSLSAEPSPWSLARPRIEVGVWSAACLAVLAAPLLAPERFAVRGAFWGLPWLTGPGLVLAALLALRLLRLGARSVGRKRPALLVLLAILGLDLIYTGNGAVITAGDNTPNRHLALEILRRGDLDLSRPLAQASAPEGTELPYYLVRVGARVLPAFPLGTGILTLPYVALGRATTATHPADELLLRWEKHAATLVSIASVLLFFVAVRRRETAATAAAATLVFALATQMVSTSSQGLWSLTGEILFFTAALGEGLRPRATRGGLAAAGLAMGCAFLCRPSALLLTGALAAMLGWRRRREAGVFLGVAAAATAGAAVWLLVLYGHPLGGYGLLNLHTESWAPASGAGLLGSFLSPSRGLLPYAPWTPLALLAARPEGAEDRRLVAVSAATILLIVVLAGTYAKWWGGHSLGPRLLAEASPFVALLTVPVWRRWRAHGLALRAALLGLLGFSVAL